MTLVFVAGTHFMKYHVYRQIRNNSNHLKRAMKILQLNEYDGLPVQIKWFDHLNIHNKKNFPDEIKNET